MEKWKKEIKKIAEKLEWNITIEEHYFYLQKYSPAGQDFNISFEAHNTEEAIAELKYQCENYDCSEAAYVWLDNTGHGTNGAPYDMKELYEDMEACLKMMNGLLQELKAVA